MQQSSPAQTVSVVNSGSASSSPQAPATVQASSGSSPQASPLVAPAAQQAVPQYSPVDGQDQYGRWEGQHGLLEVAVEMLLLLMLLMPLMPLLWAVFVTDHDAVNVS